MTSESWINRLGAALITFALTVGGLVSTVHAVGDAHKVSVVSFGLFGDQGVFKREASGAAQVVVGRFGSGPVNVQYNSKKGGTATIETLAVSLQEAAKGLDAENDVLFLVLTSHGSPAGLAVKAGRLEQTLTPSNLADMLKRTSVRHKVVVISACYSGIFIPRLANPDVLVITAADADHSSDEPSVFCSAGRSTAYLLVTSMPLRDHSLTAWPRFSVMRRKPSHLVSKTHSLSSNGSSMRVASIGL